LRLGATASATLASGADRICGLSFAAYEAPEGRSGRLWEGIISTARILILGIVMDAIYQWLVLKTFYPAQAAVIAVLLAFVPYLLLRGPFGRLARRWVARRASNF
jgi:hypothetical protein